MTLRARLTLWYTAILLAAMGLLVAAVYFEFFIQHPALGLRSRMAALGISPAEELTEAFFLASIPVILLAVIGGWFLMRRTLAPIARLTAAVERIHADNLQTQLPRTGQRDELGRLTEVFNAMTARLDDSFQRVREFTLHASHELKTPLTIIRAELETALRDDPLDTAQRQRYSSLLEELQRLTQIVDGLNFLTRADAGLLKFEQAPVRLDELVQDACADARVLAEQQQVSVRANVSGPVLVSGDRRRLRQLLLILTDNAIKYNCPAGFVNVSLLPGDRQVVLQISNTGAGIPREMLDRVFDRFFRGDASHNSEIEGCGLGLSIARRIVEAHAGEISIDSETGGETTVTVRLPARRETSEDNAASQTRQAA